MRAYDCTQPIRVNDGLRIRPYRAGDVAGLYPKIMAQKAGLFMIHSIGNAHTPADLKNEIERVNGQLREGTRLGGAVEYHGAIAGSCRIAGIKAGDTGDLGYWLFEECRGQGLITACGRALIDLAFAEFDLKKVTICAATSNTASRAVAQRLGFKLDRIQEKCLLRAGTWWDGALYVMRRERWEAQ